LIDEATALKTQPAGVLNSTVKSFMIVETSVWLHGIAGYCGSPDDNTSHWDLL